MNTSWRGKKSVVVVLGTAVLGVWGAVFLQIRTALTEPDEPIVETHRRTLDTTSVLARPAALPNVDGLRDPFEPQWTQPRPAQPLVAQTESSASPRPNIPEPEPPPLRLDGIVDETAMLSGPAGAVFFVRTGERIGDVHVEAVEATRVRLRFQTRRYALELAE